MKRYHPTEGPMEEHPDGDFYSVDEVEELLEEIMFQLFTFESKIAMMEEN
jgi:hypothetical protein